MNAEPTDLERHSREHLDRFFAAHPNNGLHRRSLKALRFVASSGERLDGRPEGWSAGIVYAVANLDRQACGVPGVLNSEIEAAFGVSMETIRRRAARVAELLDV